MLIGGTHCHEITFWELRLEGGSGGVTCDFQWDKVWFVSLPPDGQHTC